jgi:hypothetical protein
MTEKTDETNTQIADGLDSWWKSGAPVDKAAAEEAAVLAEDFQGAAGPNIFGVRRANGHWRLRATVANGLTHDQLAAYAARHYFAVRR